MNDSNFDKTTKCFLSEKDYPVQKMRVKDGKVTEEDVERSVKELNIDNELQERG